MIYLYFLGAKTVRIPLDGEHDIGGLNIGLIGRAFYLADSVDMAGC